MTQTYSVTVSDADFEHQVLEHKVVVLVDFWAPWCGPCRAIGPLIEKLAKEFEGDVLVTKLNVDENPRIAQNFGIRSVPTLMIFKEGELLKEMNGAPDPHALVEMLEDALGSES